MKRILKMKKHIPQSLLLLLLCVWMPNLWAAAQTADSSTYLADIKRELTIQWPKNRTINIVFHGHSVPAGYWHNHEVHTLESYPHLLLGRLKEKYPYAVINVIVTAIGGENALKGQTRMTNEVLAHNPDVLFIDYALNDYFAPIEQVQAAWEQMIQQALAKPCKVILVTPSPDQRIDILDSNNRLNPYVKMIRQLAEKYHVGLADPYPSFQRIAASGQLPSFMSHVNHPNQKGHEIIVDQLIRWF